MVLSALIYNLSILFALSIFSGVLVKKYPGASRKGLLVQGLLFGIAAISGMSNPLIFSNRLFFDGHSVILSLAALFFGPVSGSIAGLIAIIFRITQGGSGLMPGTLGIIFSVLIGTIFYSYQKKTNKKLTILLLFYLGFAVHLEMLLMMFTHPFPIATSIIQQIGIPVILLCPLATVLIGSILASQEVNIWKIKDIKESEETYRSFFENNFDAMLLTGTDGKIYTANPAACKMFGYTEKEFIKWGIFGILDMADPNLSKILSKCAIIKNVNIEIVFIHKNGTHFPAEVTSTAFKNHKTKNQIIMMIHDIAERKRIEKELRDSEEKIRLIVENSHDGIEIIQDDLILYSNIQFAEMLGYSLEELYEMKFSQLLSGQALNEPDEHQRKRIDDSYTYETTFIKKDKTIIHVDVNCEVIGYNGKPATFVTVRDITRRKLTEESLRDREEDIVRLHNQLMTQFLQKTVKELSESGTKVQKQYSVIMK